MEKRSLRMGIKEIQKDTNHKGFLVEKFDDFLTKKKIKERMLTTNNNEQDH